MKTVIVIFGALLMVGLAASNKITEAITECAAVNNLDRAEIVAHLNENVIPEDNADLAKFIVCFSTAIGTADKDGNLNTQKLEDVLTEMLKQKLGSSIPDVDAKARHIASTSIASCKDTPKANDIGTSLIKMRNCIKAEAQKTQPH